MSIEICDKCCKHIDTDYNVEDMVYQNDIPYCLDCAKEYTFKYYIKDQIVSRWSFKDNKVIKAKTTLIGWIGAIDVYQALDRIQDRYKCKTKDIEIKADNTLWSETLEKLKNDNG